VTLDIDAAVNCERFASTPTLEEVRVDIDMTAKGADIMKADDIDGRLTPVQREIRDRCGNVPKHIRRSIDAYRIARGMVPLWASPQQRNGKG
jgi:hypothetical protein